MNLNFNELTRWKLITLLFGIALLIYSLSFRLIVESATIQKCNAMLYEQYFDEWGNLKKQNMTENNIDLNLSEINISIRR